MIHLIKYFCVTVLLLHLFGCKKKSPEVFFDVLEHRASLETVKKEFDPSFLYYTDVLGNTALHKAVKINNLEVATWLLRLGSDPFQANKEGQSPYQIARQGNNEKLMLSMEQNYMFKWKKKENSFSEEFLAFAVEHDLALMVREFLSQGTPADYEISDTGLPLLIAAIFNDSKRVIALLLSEKANPNIAFDTRPALQVAALFGQYDICEMLLQNGANPNAVDGTKTTALMLAMEEGFLDIEKLLLKYGANKDARDIAGKTAIERKKAKIN